MFRDFLNYFNCDWEERVVFASWRNVQNKDGDEKEQMKYCSEAVKMMTEWWSEEGHYDVQEDKKESKYHANELLFLKIGINKI